MRPQTLLSGVVLSRVGRCFASGLSTARFSSMPPRKFSTDPLTEAETRRLKLLQVEYDSWLADKEPLPTKVSDKVWMRIVRECPTEDSRRLFYQRLIVYENRKLEKQRSRSAQALQEAGGPSDMQAGEGLVFPDVPSACPYQPQAVHQHRVLTLPDEYRLVQSFQFGQPIVLDMRFANQPGLEDPMASAMCAQQAYGVNRRLREPFHLHLCSANPSKDWYRLIRSRFTAEPADGRHPRQWPADYLATITSLSFMQLFPRESLVYLSPNSSEIMNTFDHDAVYIIGGLMDRTVRDTKRMHTVHMAEKLGIRCMSLPMQLYADWDFGTWCLSHTKVIEILAEVRSTGDWHQAFKKFLPVVNRPKERT